MIIRTHLTQHQLAELSISVQVCVFLLRKLVRDRASFKSNPGDIICAQVINSRHTVQGLVQNGGNFLIVSHLPHNSVFHWYWSYNVSKIGVPQEGDSSHVSGRTVYRVQVVSIHSWHLPIINSSARHPTNRTKKTLIHSTMWWNIRQLLHEIRSAVPTRKSSLMEVICKSSQTLQFLVANALFVPTYL
jgi:hypothetical protein